MDWRPQVQFPSINCHSGFKPQVRSSAANRNILTVPREFIGQAVFLFCEMDNQLNGIDGAIAQRTVNGIESEFGGQANEEIEREVGKKRKSNPESHRKRNQRRLFASKHEEWIQLRRRWTRKFSIGLEFLAASRRRMKQFTLRWTLCSQRSEVISW